MRFEVPGELKAEVSGELAGDIEFIEKRMESNETSTRDSVGV